MSLMDMAIRCSIGFHQWKKRDVLLRFGEYYWKSVAVGNNQIYGIRQCVRCKKTQIDERVEWGFDGASRSWRTVTEQDLSEIPKLRKELSKLKLIV